MSQLKIPHITTKTQHSHGILQARILEWVAVPFSGRSFRLRDQTQGSNPGLLHCRRILYRLSHQKSLFKKNTAGRCKVGGKTCRLDLCQRGQTKIHRPRKFCLGHLHCMSNGLWVFLFFAQVAHPQPQSPRSDRLGSPLKGASLGSLALGW